MFKLFSNKTSTDMAKINALTCVALNDICSLRIVCTMARDKKQELEEVDEYGNTALLKACYMGRLEAAVTLLQFGAEVRAINYCGQNALTLATFSGNICLVEKLLHHCSYKEFNQNTLTPALCVATLHQYWPVVKYLKELDPENSDDIQTVHGLNSDDIEEFIKMSKVPL